MSRTDPPSHSSRFVFLNRGLPWLTAALALAAYVTTVPPGLTFEHHGTDGGDLVTAAYTLGVPHPTGYPTYTLLAWLVSHLLPWGTIAYRVNLLSATCAAATVGLCCHIAQRLLVSNRTEPRTWYLALAASLSLAFSPLFWSQGIIAEVYALLALFATLLLWAVIRWRRSGRDRWLLLAALTLGLGLGNHVILALVAPACLILLWPERRRWFRIRLVVPALALFFAGLGIYAYLPLAAAHHPPVNWGNPQTWERFFWVVTGEQYQSFVLGLDLKQIPQRLYAWAALAGEQFGWWGLLLVLAGAWRWGQRDRTVGYFGPAWLLPLSLYAFLYDTGDAHVYLVAVLPLAALWWAEGARHLVQLAGRLKPIWQRLALVLLILLPFISLALNWQATSLRGDDSVQDYVNQVLDAVAPDSLVVVRGDRPTFALWYALYAEGQRPDVAVVSGPLLAYIWYRNHARHLYPALSIPEPAQDTETFDDLVRELVAQNLERRPIYATDPKEAWFSWFEFERESDGIVYRIRSGGKTPPQASSP